MDLGTKIRKLREFQSLSREYVATQLKMDKRTLEKIENSQRDIQIKELEAIAKLLGTSSQNLLHHDPIVLFSPENSIHDHPVSEASTTQSMAEMKTIYESVISKFEKVLADKDLIIEALKQQIRKMK